MPDKLINYILSLINNNNKISNSKISSINVKNIFRKVSNKKQIKLDIN
jgi:hypothetical protein